ncbi:STAS domain-containing protein [Anabaena cylindrica FACHB-243]|uniref:Anti-sigma factor antagonist n=1 Tax=Anabaena cylindrica (strain ATCC 27899 / PCC 7122) TaxID=272123 RepID=K9ZCW8_ANACC|nr:MULTISPECIES: STAS domain-containing protein [Anabaena]AFZ57073.1 anti-anti-sigma factor [Anabaena cylindrica PCC 7122]MBD2421452.1 STAS domain-containing protein [Anabaena cylindrica FACHB-243]MBY5284570.1 STAS domain-containing protein [Anabaena sp. CCAP 1446/1C]MBY5310823.1 STAS domain-containing protein [Anabaena sp. CCAP 1446/1C]MCM2407789.1 STAS domain-containing protein [Anabaena sp. CCAP 1446/1C]
MSLQIYVETTNPTTLCLALDGQLDTLTATDLDKSIHNSLTPNIQTLILDLQKLSFISSAGLRILAKARKTMKSREGKVYFTHPTPQVKKVFDIVKAVPLSEVFSNTQELDAYLEAMQAEVDGESD